MIEALSCFWGGDGIGKCLMIEGCESVTAMKLASASKIIRRSDESDTDRSQPLPLISSTFSLLKFISLVGLFHGARSQRTDPFPAQMDLASLNGTNGFIIGKVSAYSNFGNSVSYAGDVNQDGVDDILIGAPGSEGGAYIIYGNTNFGKNLDFLDIKSDLTYYLKIPKGHVNDLLGWSVSNAGDFNEDGIDDFLIGAQWGRPSADRGDAGKTYLIYGNQSLDSTENIDVSILNGMNGYAIFGEERKDSSGNSVSHVGDFNGDGIPDIIIGAWRATTSTKLKPNTGKSYVIFGGKNLNNNGTLELSRLDGNNGFALHGDSFDFSGYSVSSAGDFNHDGMKDILIGAPGDSDRATPGKTYLLFGSKNIIAGGVIKLENLDGTDGILINGMKPGDDCGRSVSNAGDINADGIPDIVIGAPNVHVNVTDKEGRAYVIFGSQDFGKSGVFELSELNGSNGFVIKGENSGDNLGKSVSNAGDLNGDGIPDLLIGAPHATANGKDNAGKIYVIFGNPNIGISGTLELTSLDGLNGFVMLGAEIDQTAGTSVSYAGDVNDDGLTDIIIGAPNQLSLSIPGQAYVIFGRNLSYLQPTIQKTAIATYFPPTLTTTVFPSSKKLQTTPFIEKVPSVTQPNSTPQFVAIAISINLLAGSVLAAGIYYLKRRSDSNQPVDAQGGEAAPQDPNSEYMILSHALSPHEGYTKGPRKQPHNTEEHNSKTKCHDAQAEYDDITTPLQF